ncbi:Pentose-5-phosphate-3-epimerase [endosymbiont of Acanthamoeba sp. UWC8]|uniref:ribulose-phosphate 3-epimerase n=1 Tax=endosymbiont of Acanthamoeba sp. UWC8 TaxID=86106 RepID=UPI0004D18F8D|nr:ribulose-phosphate 3-epimerase [endosymbiont of Acanthamoeba sp. UWC8]AIF81092.1 Pentose-5-phosphate-3-epimerase [endosymbiont of Acanthamoeba sp. UWC8]
MQLKIAPSILSSDFAILGEEVKRITEAGADYIHIDVMDGSFVPNITLGSNVVKSIRKYSPLPFDVHLMVSNPEQHVEQFAQAGADIITFHAEATVHIERLIDKIHSLGKKAGISLVPSSDESILNYLYDKIDLILVMTVNPGFGGQSFIPSQLVKIKNIRRKIIESKRNIDLQVDGGINDSTARMCKEAGANIVVAGSYIFREQNYAANIQSLKQV